MRDDRATRANAARPARRTLVGRTPRSVVGFDELAKGGNLFIQPFFACRSGRVVCGFRRLSSTAAITSLNERFQLLPPLCR
jgi:hypothetical protein